jgi:hypothetical protein
LESEAPGNAEEKVRRAWWLAYGREAEPEEVAALAAFAGKHGWDQACLVLFNNNEFLFLK